MRPDHPYATLGGESMPRASRGASVRRESVRAPGSHAGASASSPSSRASYERLRSSRATDRQVVLADSWPELRVFVSRTACVECDPVVLWLSRGAARQNEPRRTAAVTDQPVADEAFHRRLESCGPCSSSGHTPCSSKYLLASSSRSRLRSPLTLIRRRRLSGGTNSPARIADENRLGSDWGPPWFMCHHSLDELGQLVGIGVAPDDAVRAGDRCTAGEPRVETIGVHEHARRRCHLLELVGEANALTDAERRREQA